MKMNLCDVWHATVPWVVQYIDWAIYIQASEFMISRGKRNDCREPNSLSLSCAVPLKGPCT